VADQRPWIVVAGERLVDRVIRPDGRVEEHPGGGPFNTARALGRLGARVAFVGGLSDDDGGRQLRRTLEADGVDLSFAQTVDRPTLVATATLDAAGVASYRFDPPDSAAAMLTSAELPQGAAVLHVGTLGLVLEPTSTTIARLVAAAPRGVLVMLDPNIRPAAIADGPGYRARLDAVLARADVVKASVDDLRWLEPRQDADVAAELLLTAGAAAVLVTNGPAPVRVVTGAAITAVPVPDVAVVDTIGAGDAFSAGFLAAWTSARHGRADLADADAIVEAVRSAIRVASWSVGRAGAGPPTRDDLAG